MVRIPTIPTKSLDWCVCTRTKLIELLIERLKPFNRESEFESLLFKGTLSQDKRISTTWLGKYINSLYLTHWCVWTVQKINVFPGDFWCLIWLYRVGVWLETWRAVVSVFTQLDACFKGSDTLLGKKNKLCWTRFGFTCYLNPPKNLENSESSSPRSENGRWTPEKTKKWTRLEDAGIVEVVLLHRKLLSDLVQVVQPHVLAPPGCWCLLSESLWSLLCLDCHEQSAALLQTTKEDFIWPTRDRQGSVKRFGTISFKKKDSSSHPVRLHHLGDSDWLEERSSVGLGWTLTTRWRQNPIQASWGDCRVQIWKNKLGKKIMKKKEEPANQQTNNSKAKYLRPPYAPLLDSVALVSKCH